MGELQYMRKWLTNIIKCYKVNRMSTCSKTENVFISLHTSYTFIHLHLFKHLVVPGMKPKFLLFVQGI